MAPRHKHIFEKEINFSRDIEQRLRERKASIDGTKLVHRIMVFSRAGSCLSDYTFEETAAIKNCVRFMSKIKSEFIVNFLVQITSQHTSQQYETNNIPRWQFQQKMEVKLFNTKCLIIYNKIMGIATFVSPESSAAESSAQILLTRYLFSQFWKEYSFAVLKDFFELDNEARRIKKANQGISKFAFGKQDAGMGDMSGTKSRSNKISNQLSNAPQNIPSKDLLRYLAHDKMENHVKCSLTTSVEKRTKEYYNPLAGALLGSIGVEEPVQKMEQAGESASGQKKENPVLLISEEQVNVHKILLFIMRMYEQLPMDYCLQQFSRCFNELFVYEKPGVTHKYAISQIQIVEMRIPTDIEQEQEFELAKMQEREVENAIYPKHFEFAFSHTFCTGTSREMKFENSQLYINFIKQLCLEDYMKQKQLEETEDPKFVPYHQRGKENLDQRHQSKEEKSRWDKEPNYGDEYFFSNICIKIQQVSNLFYDSSLDNPPESLSYIVTLWEKQTRKRQPANNRAAQEKLKKRKHTPNKIRYENHFMVLREQRQQRFINFFLTLYDLEHIDPFRQFIKSAAINEIHEKMTTKLETMLDKYERKTIQKRDPKYIGSSSGTDEDLVESHLAAKPIKENRQLKKIDHHFQDWRECFKFRLQSMIMFKPRHQVEHKIFGSKRIGAQEDPLNFAVRLVKIQHDNEEMCREGWRTTESKTIDANQTPNQYNNTINNSHMQTIALSEQFQFKNKGFNNDNYLMTPSDPSLGRSAFSPSITPGGVRFSLDDKNDESPAQQNKGEDSMKSIVMDWFKRNEDSLVNATKERIDAFLIDYHMIVKKKKQQAAEKSEQSIDLLAGALSTDSIDGKNPFKIVADPNDEDKKEKFTLMMQETTEIKESFKVQHLESIQSKIFVPPVIDVGLGDPIKQQDTQHLKLPKTKAQLKNKKSDLDVVGINASKQSAQVEPIVVHINDQTNEGGFKLQQVQPF